MHEPHETLVPRPALQTVPKPLSDRSTQALKVTAQGGFADPDELGQSFTSSSMPQLIFAGLCRHFQCPFLITQGSRKVYLLWVSINAPDQAYPASDASPPCFSEPLLGECSCCSKQPSHSEQHRNVQYFELPISL